MNKRAGAPNEARGFAWFHTQPHAAHIAPDNADFFRVFAHTVYTKDGADPCAGAFGRLVAHHGDRPEPVLEHFRHHGAAEDSGRARNYYGGF